MSVFSTVARPVIMAAGRSDGLRRTAQRVPITRRVVDRFVPGETIGDVLDAVVPLRDSQRFISIDYLGEDVTDTETADATVAAYHDQGLAPLKAVDFDRSVNITLGLPHLRTSPDHGTAFGIAGQGRADGRSFAAAIRMAERLARAQMRLGRVE